MARLDADLLLLAFKTAHYAKDPLDDITRKDLTTQSLEVARAIREEIDKRVEEILMAKGIR